MVVYGRKVSDFVAALVSQNILRFNAIEQLEVRDVCSLGNPSLDKVVMQQMVHMDGKRTDTLLLFSALKRMCITAHKMSNRCPQSAAASERPKENIDHALRSTDGCS